MIQHGDQEGQLNTDTIAHALLSGTAAGQSLNAAATTCVEAQTLKP